MDDAQDKTLNPVARATDTALRSEVADSQGARRFRIWNETRGSALAAAAEVAGTGAQRSRGLLGRTGLAPGEALWIVPCEAVHTFFMKFALDLVYLDRRHRIVKIKRNVVPWRLSGCLRAHSVIEFAAGAPGPEAASVGDQLIFEPTSNRMEQQTRP
jgi:uncharacterized membrane protein (UPF0127 family)